MRWAPRPATRPSAAFRHDALREQPLERDHSSTRETFPSDRDPADSRTIQTHTKATNAPPNKSLDPTALRAAGQLYRSMEWTPQGPRAQTAINRGRHASSTEGGTGMSPNITDHLAQDKLARITGGFYLGYFVAAVLATMLGQIGLGTAQQVYQAIVTNAWSFRLGLVVALISGFLFLMAAWGLYVLLRPVNKYLALLFLLLNAVGVAIQGASMLSLVSAMFLGGGASYMQAHSAAQLEGLAYLSINVYKTGWVTAQLFFGTWLFPLGYLVYKSKSLPRFLGVLLMLDGIGVLIWFLQALLLPAYRVITYPGLAVSFIAELGLALWLLVKGVKVIDSAAGLPR